MCKEAFVYGQDSFGFYSFDQAVEYPIVQIPRLIIHPRHYRVCHTIRTSALCTFREIFETYLVDA